MRRRDLFTAAAALGLTPLLSSCGLTPQQQAVAIVPGAGPTLASGAPSGTFGALSDALATRLASGNRNLAFSPFSIGVALAMARGGAVGETGAQLDTLLRVPPERLPATVNTLWRAMAHGKAKLSGGNAVWGQQDLGWKDPFQQYLRDFGAPLQERNIAGEPDRTRLEINGWVKDTTAGLIPELLPQGVISEMTRLVLVNALLFGASWQRPLYTIDPAPFTTRTGARVQAPMLAGGGRWRVAETGTWRGTVLPTEDPDFGLALVLPRSPDAVVTRVANAAAFSVLAKAGLEAVELLMPSWRIDQRVDLLDVLKQLGVTLAFDPERADFSAMTDRQKLFIAFILHQSVVKVDESGIEAAAATAVGVDTSSAPGLTIKVTLDRPFGWALLHLPTSTPLFTGVVADPTRTE